MIDIDVKNQADTGMRERELSLDGVPDKIASATSLRELSASIAHEVNQPLAAIVATCHACRRWLSTDPPNLERAKVTLERIVRDANSASELVGRIREKFDQIDNAWSKVDIAEVITEACRLTADELDARNIQLATDLDRSLPPVLIDRTQIQEVVISLIRNAIAALETVADVTKVIKLSAGLDGDATVRVEIRRAGLGAKEPQFLFEPICRSIIESHNGRLWAISNQPGGTLLLFTLPTEARDAT